MVDEADELGDVDEEDKVEVEVVKEADEVEDVLEL